LSVQKCPQFAVNSQLATRNPQLAVYCPLKVGSGHAANSDVTISDIVSPSPQGRVGTIRSVPTEILYNQIAVPSRSGRDAIRRSSSPLGGRSPSPQGRVGTFDAETTCRLLQQSPSPQGRVGTMLRTASGGGVTESPSPQGRVGTVLWTGLTFRCSRSPSPQGRVGTRR